MKNMIRKNIVSKVDTYIDNDDVASLSSRIHNLE
ncbi:MAG: hypothetical protein Ct9H90mP3_8470 [Flammeovirgaceae bacterium]|nr:MAG: hypothetical protein Ct9H90mP3_8470 [Flammeovirgaceae bacterium]